MKLFTGNLSWVELIYKSNREFSGEEVGVLYENCSVSTPYGGV